MECGRDSGEVSRGPTAQPVSCGSDRGRIPAPIYFMADRNAGWATAAGGLIARQDELGSGKEF